MPKDDIEASERDCQGIRGMKHRLKIRLIPKLRGKPGTCKMVHPPHKDWLSREFYGDKPYWDCKHGSYCTVCDELVEYHVPMKKCPTWRARNTD